MSLSQLHIADKAILDGSSKHQVLSFENRVKCLNSVFWSLYAHLENAQKTLLVLDRHEDWEYLNYLMGYYKVSPLMLKLQNEQGQISKPAMEKIKAQRLPLSQENESKDQDELENVYAHLKKSVHQIFSPIISNLNLLDIIQKLSLQREAMPYIFSQSYRLITMTEVKNKKQLLHTAQTLYNADFKFIDQYHPITASALKDYTTESLQVILNDLHLDINQLIVALEDIKQGISRKISSDNEIFNKIQLAFNELNQRINESGLDNCQNDLEFRNVLHQIASWLNTAVNDETSIDQSLEALKDSFAKAVKSYQVEESKLNDSIYKNYNRTNADEKSQVIFCKLDKFLIELDKANLLRGWVFRRPNTLTDYLSVAYETKDILEHAIYHTKNIDNYDKWNAFVSSLKAEDQQLINDIKRSSADWPEVFEYSFLKYYIEFKSNAIEPIAGRVNKLNTLIGKLPERRSNEILNKFFLNGNNKEILLSDSGELYNEWETFLKERGADLTNKFPVIIVDKAFFQSNIGFLIAHIENLVTVNFIPQQWPNEDWITNKITGYTSPFLEQTTALSQKTNAVKVTNIEGIEFNINRSLKEVTPNELTQLSLYIGYELKRINPDFRIFQLKDISIISFLRNQLNAHVMEHFASQGMKEIFHSQQDYNLLPGIFSNTSQKITILLEDNLINNKRKDLPLSQLLLINKLKVLGIQLISFDNFEFIKNEMKTVEKLIDAISPNSFETISSK